jgi:hypothetical protein
MRFHSLIRVYRGSDLALAHGHRCRIAGTLSAMRTWCCYFVLAAALAACNKDEAKPAPATTPAAASAAPAAQGPAMVELFVDDKSVGRIAPPQVQLWPRLDSLVPMSARRLGTWQLVAVKGKSGKPVEIDQPSAKHRELVPALFPGEGGLPAFGMFDPVELAKQGAPALFREDGVTEVRIKLAQGSGRGENDHGDHGGDGDPNKLELTIKTAKGEQVLTGARLLELPRHGPPDEQGDGQGWNLTAVIEAAGIKKYERVLVADAAGVNLTLEKRDLDPKKSVPFLKLNRQGQLRFRVYKKEGEHWQIGGDLRGLARIEILK